jgi:hypothetical protein
MLQYGRNLQINHYIIINTCCMFLKVINISNIVDAEGDRIREEMLAGKQDTQRVSDLE